MMKVVTGIGPCDEESPQNRRNIAFVFLGGRQHLQETELMRFKRGGAAGDACKACLPTFKNQKVTHPHGKK